MLVFNKERAKFYSFNEVYLEAPKKHQKKSSTKEYCNFTLAG